MIEQKIEWIEKKYNQQTRLMESKPQGEATLLAFGVDFEELNQAAGIFSTAIIALPDGSVKNIPVENIKFI
jgi:hypothetical protein